MKYKLRNNYTTNPELALSDILKDRGVTDIENFLQPSFSCELNPYDLDNIEDGVAMLLKHLHNKSNILFVVD